MAESSITDWLMFGITFIYVVATILICLFNHRSAKAAQDQLAESQKQQSQNIALQCYAMRREVVHKFLRKEYDDLYADIPLLFDKTTLDEFVTFTEQERALASANEVITQTECELSKHLEEYQMAVITDSRTAAIQGVDIEGIKKNIDALTKLRSIPSSLRTRCKSYIKAVEQVRNLAPLVERLSTALREKLITFVRNSIQ